MGRGGDAGPYGAGSAGRGTGWWLGRPLSTNALVRRCASLTVPAATDLNSATIIDVR